MLCRTPLIYPKVHLDSHRSLLHQFPFSCYYLVAGDVVIVYGLFHCARNPAFVMGLLDLRDGDECYGPKAIDAKRSFVVRNKTTQL